MSEFSLSFLTHDAVFFLFFIIDFINPLLSPIAHLYCRPENIFFWENPKYLVTLAAL